MTVEELARMGREMREAQKAFFRGDKAGLQKAKDLERRFDEACGEVLDGPRPKQGELFGEGRVR